MSDEITPAAPRAAHTTGHDGSANAAPPVAQNTATETQNTPASAPTHTAPTTAPAQADPTTTTNLTFNEKLNANDRYWKFKLALRVATIVVGLIGIGTIGWAVSTNPGYGFTYGYDSEWALWPMLLSFPVSVVWCSICVLVLLLRKKPIHPGARVGVDLILWLGIIGTALCGVVALIDITQWGEYGDLGYGGYSSRYGGYELAANGTWVWESDSSSSSTSYTRSCNGTSSSSYYYSTPSFSSCAEQDAYINKLWSEKGHRVDVELTGVVCQFLILVLHLTLFVWACVDCHRHNHGKTSKDAEKLAADIVQTMISNGAIVPPPGQAHVRQTWGAQPQMGYYQLPQQQGQQGGYAYPMQPMYPQGQNGMMHPPPHAQGAAPVAGPSGEKSQGPRYA